MTTSHLNPTQLTSIVSFLDRELGNKEYQHADIALNGLQVCAGQTIKCIAFAVDACQASIESALEAKAQLLIVHHGLYWGKSVHPAVGLHGERLAALFRSGLSLYASHLPLDGHQRLGNAAQLATFLGFSTWRPAFPCFADRAHCGVIASAASAISRDQILDKLKTLPYYTAYPELTFGSHSVQEVAIASGSASSLLQDLPALGIDTLISGEPKHEAFHLAQELRVNAFFAGHYATERMGLQALAEALHAEFQVVTHWIEHPTGL
jgi:dinuclear metal center YbgI/SA1388 family protein